MILDDEAYLEALKKKRDHDSMIEATKRTAESGGLAGAVLGGLGSVAGGQKKLSGLALAMLRGGGLGAALGGGSQYLGQQIEGPVDDSEGGGHANRGALGGAVAGGLGGLAVGGLLGAGKLGWLKKAAPAAEFVLGKEAAHHAFDNIATDQLKKMLAKGQTGRLAAALGLGGAAIGGAQGFNEGVDADYARSLEHDDEDQYR